MRCPVGVRSSSSRSFAQLRICEGESLFINGVCVCVCVCVFVCLKTKNSSLQVLRAIFFDIFGHLFDILL